MLNETVSSLITGEQTISFLTQIHVVEQASSKKPQLLGHKASKQVNALHL